MPPPPPCLTMHFSLSIRWTCWHLWKPSTRQWKLPSWPLTWVGPSLTAIQTGCSSIRYWIFTLCLQKKAAAVFSHPTITLEFPPRFTGDCCSTTVHPVGMAHYPRTHTKHSSSVLFFYAALSFGLWTEEGYGHKGKVLSDFSLYNKLLIVKILSIGHATLISTHSLTGTSYLLLLIAFTLLTRLHQIYSVCTRLCTHVLIVTYCLWINNNNNSTSPEP